MMPRTFSGSRVMSIPSMKARPDVGLRSVASILIVVVFPAPFGPMKPKISPGSRRKQRSFTATT